MKHKQEYIVRYRVVGRWDQMISRTYPTLKNALECALSAYARKAGDVSINGVRMDKRELEGMLSEFGDILGRIDPKVESVVGMLIRNDR